MFSENLPNVAQALPEQELAKTTFAESLVLAATLLQEDGPSLADRYRWLEAMINHVPDYIYAKDLGGRFLFANEAVVRDNALTSVDELVGLTDADLHGEEVGAAISNIERRVMQSGVPDLGFDERAIKGGHDRWLMMSRVPLKDADGKIVGVVGASRDITARKMSETLLAVQAQVLEMIVASVPGHALLERLVRLLDDTAADVHATAFSTLNGQTFQLVAGTAFGQLERTAAIEVDGKSSAAHEVGRYLKKLCLPNEFVSCFDICSSTGALHAVLVLVMAGREPDPAYCNFLTSIARLAGIALDRLQAEDRIRFLAEHDALTGMLKRDRLDVELQNAMSKAARDNQRIGVAFLDIDDFKLVNDSLGHGAGDELLKEVARRITSSLGPSGIAARIGGDEFVVVLDGPEPIQNRAETLRALLRQSHCIRGHVLQTTVSLGLSIFPDHGDNASELLARADLAMYRAKQNGRDRSILFTMDMATEAKLKLKRLEELRRAILSNEIFLHYQPQKDLKSGEIVGLEALVRWDHPREGVLAPSTFIPLAEESGMILDLGAKVLEDACRQARVWQDEGLAPVKIGVNMSPRQFQEPDLTNLVAAVLERTGLDPAWLEIEITESLIMKDVDAAITRMDELAELGVSLALDDFGTGYSSLARLSRFPLSLLKIDRSFIAGDQRGTSNKAIVSAIISLARTLDLDIVAEGVETEEQADFLLAAGCDKIQGYLIGRPSPPEVIRQMLVQQAR